MEKIHVDILQTPVEVSSQTRDTLISISKTQGEIASRVLEIEHPFNITIYPNPAWCIRETGEGGYTPSADWLQIYLDLSGTTHPVDEVVEARFPAALYHEINHIKRWGTVGYGTTLKEAIVSEGLASVFEEEMWAAYKVPWLTYSSEEIEKFIALVVERAPAAATSFSQGEWFFGATPDIPRWLGYKLGHHIVREALKRDKNLTLVSLTSAPAEEVIFRSGIKI